MLIVRVGGGTQSLTSTNGGSIRKGKMPAGDVGLDIIDDMLDAFELMLSVGKLAT